MELNPFSKPSALALFTITLATACLASCGGSSSDTGDGTDSDTGIGSDTVDNTDTGSTEANAIAVAGTA